jgi:hypothetical protein
MKLLFCAECTDLVRLFGGRRSCRCGASAGRYLDEAQVEVSGPAVVLGVGNDDFQAAYRRLAEDPAHSHEFKGFTLPHPCSTVTRVPRAR